MGKLILKNVSVMIDGEDLTDRARSVNIDTSAEEIDVTAFGGSGWREFEPGLKAGTIEVEFYQDFESGSVHSILWPLAEANSEFEIRIGPDGDTGGSSNPIFVGNVKLFGYRFLQGEVGAASTNPVTFRLTGAPNLATT